MKCPVMPKLPRLLPTATGRIRRRPAGHVALREIRYYQKEEGTILPRTTFQKIIREIGYDFGPYRWEKIALLNIQELAENFISRYLKGKFLAPLYSNICLSFSRCTGHFIKCEVLGSKAAGL